MQKVAQEFATQANSTPDAMIRETPYVQSEDDVPEIGNNQQFHNALAALNNPNDIGDAIGVKSGFAIPMLIDKKEPRIPEFDEVKAKVRDTVKQQRAKDQLEQKAKDLLASATTPDALKAAGEKEGFESANDDGFKLGTALGKAGTSPQLDELVFAMKDGEMLKAPVKVGDSWVVLGVTKRHEADLTQFFTQRDRLRDSMLRDRQDQVFDDYISSVQEKMKRDGKIKIYDDVLDSLPEEEEPQTPGGLNLPG